MEADVYPLNAPDKAAAIDGSLGDGSPFQGMNGYYAHGVGPETAKAPAGWEDRLVRVEILPRVRQRTEVVALCLEAHDLVLSKCVAGRERDWEFAQAAITAGLVDTEELHRRSATLPRPPADQQHARRPCRQGCPGRRRQRRLNSSKTRKLQGKLRVIDHSGAAGRLR